MKFKIADHQIRNDVQVVEVFDDSGRFIAQICPGDNDREIRIVSKYMTHDPAVVSSESYPVAVTLLLNMVVHATELVDGQEKALCGGETSEIRPENHRLIPLPLVGSAITCRSCQSVFESRQ